MFLSDGFRFVGDLDPRLPGWTPAGFGTASKGWYVGNFNGIDPDGKKKYDIMRATTPTGRAHVLLSNGSSFANPVALTSGKFHEKEWYIGDFDGDKKDDLMRVQNQSEGAEVLLTKSASRSIRGCQGETVATGVVFGSNTFLCSTMVPLPPVSSTLGGIIVDEGPNRTVRQNMHACPLGTVLVGADFTTNSFACARLPYR
jgi:hypothetical protein